MPQTYDQPGSEYEHDDPDAGYDGGAVGDPFDSRGGYQPETGTSGNYDSQKTPLGDSSDPTKYDPQKTPLMDDSNPLDTGEEKPGRKDGRGKLQKESSGVRKNLKSAERESGFYRPDEKDSDEASPSDLDDAETEAGTNEGFYNNARQEKSRAHDRAKRFAQKHKKKIAIGGGIGLGVAGGVSGILLFIIPLKIEHIVNNLEGTFFSTAQGALREESANMVKSYMLTRVLPGYNTCGSTIEKGCSALRFGSNPVSNLYRSWADARIENKLAAKGIYLQHKTLSGEWILHTPGVDSKGVPMGSDGEGFTQTFKHSSTAKAALDSALEEATQSRQVMFRYQVGRLFGGKYKGDRHIIFSGKRNALGDNIHNKKIAAKLYLAQRVILPHNEVLGVALICLIQGSTCHATDNQPSGSDGENGTPRSQYNTDTINALEKVAGKNFDAYTANKLLDTYNSIAEVGFQKYLVTKALAPIIGDAGAGAASDAIPIVGWVNLAAQIVNAGNNSSGSLKKLRFVTNGATAVSLYMMYRTFADEIHTGGDDATEIGSFNNSLGPGDQGSPTDPAVGGTAGAEQSPLYGSLIDGDNTPTKSPDYLCNNGKPVPDGQRVCPEEELSGGNGIANGIHDFLNLPGVNVITLIAQGWGATVGKVFDLGNSILGSALSVAVKPFDAVCSVPVLGDTNPWCVAKKEADKYLPIIVEGVTKWLIPDPFSTAMSGGRTFDMMAAGADVLGNDTAHNVMGGQKLTDGQRAQIVSAQQEEAQTIFSQQPFFARMFNTDNQNSLVSKVAMEVPLGGTQVVAQDSLASLLNPIGILSHSFGSIFSGNASAAAAVQPDAFGVPQYGYPEGTIPSDAEAYWKNHCSDNEANGYQNDNDWNEAASGEANADPDNGEPLNKTTNPCMLIKAVVGADGGLFDSSNLTQGDLDSVNGAADDGGSTPTDTASATIDMSHLYDSSVSVACADGTNDDGTADGYHEGKKIKIRLCEIPNFPSSATENKNGHAVMNSRVSGAVLAMITQAKKDGVNPSAVSTFRTMSEQQGLWVQYGMDPARVAPPGYSNHQMGMAIDFNDVGSSAAPGSGPVWDWLAKNASNFGYKNYPAEAWHWSPTGN